MKLRVFTVAFVLVTLCSVSRVRGYPTGAPRNRKTCRTLKPHHHSARGQQSAPPFAVIPAKAAVPAGASVDIVLSALQGHDFKGFMLQARPRMIAEEAKYIRPIGSFEVKDPTLSKTLDCLSGERNTVTHTSPAHKTNVTFTWTPPAQYKGSVYFKATFVQDYKTFWLNVSSHIVVGEGVGDSLSDGEVVSEDNHEASVRPMFSIYEACKTSMLCLGDRDDCIGDHTCDVLVSGDLGDNNIVYDFIWKYSKYMPLEYLETNSADFSSLACAMIENESKVRKSRFNTGDITFSDSNFRDTVLNSSYIDGFLYCKFLREEFKDNESILRDLGTTIYFLVMVAVDGEWKREHISVNMI